MGWRSGIQTVVQTLYPTSCLSCGDAVEGDAGLCSKCWLESHFVAGLVCNGCGAPLPGLSAGVDVELIEQINNLNNGNYLDGLNQNTPTDFCIGAAGYPEKHFEAMNLTSDLKHLKEKVDAGAEFIVTQLFFDNQKYFDFVARCRDIGINVPIIPGLKPITNMRHISFLPKFFNVDLPVELSNELDKCTTNEQVKNVGIEWGIKQAQELVKNNVPVLHFYTMGRGEAVKAIASEVF